AACPLARNERGSVRTGVGHGLRQRALGVLAGSGPRGSADRDGESDELRRAVASVVLRGQSGGRGRSRAGRRGGRHVPTAAASVLVTPRLPRGRRSRTRG